MIIFGTRGVTWNGESGEFVCPGCGGTTQQYTRKTIRRFFTLYFIPLIPLDKLGEYIECQHCRNTYNEQVLNYNPAAMQEKARAEFVEHVKRIMVLAAIVHGRIDEAKLDAIRETYRDLSGTTLSNFDIQQELALARQAKGGMPAYAARFAGNLNEHGKEMVLKSVLAVLAADEGMIGQEELDLLNELAASMNVSQAHLRGILAELNE
jgi:uncharacterized membrane protein YebE (DUF533 family)